MLKQRLLTAAVLIPLVVFGVLHGSSAAVGVIFAIILAAGAWEWGRLSGIRQGWGRALGVVATLGAIGGLYLVGFAVSPEAPLLRGVVGIGLAAWILALAWLARPALGQGASAVSTAVKLLAGLLILPVAWVSLVAIHSIEAGGPALLLYMVVLIWIADSGAYFAGKRFGRNKLAPAISPGKTREGAFGGLAAVAIYSLIMAQVMEAVPLSLTNFVLLSVFTGAISIAGDLFESLLKRQAGLKDSGAVLPGHGGVLDRIDSLLAALPVFAAGVWVLSRA